jgi:hypothetical protein
MVCTASGCKAFYPGRTRKHCCPRGKPILSAAHLPGFVAALFSGGDSRITPDPVTGLNQYLCPVVLAPDHVYAASCTASPASLRAIDAAGKAFAGIRLATSPRQRADRLAVLADDIEARLCRHLDVGSLARIFLCPSGTDALLTTTRLIAAERPDEAMTTILPAASETGTGVPMAAAGRIFNGPDCGKSLLCTAAQTIEIPLRSQDGAPYADDTVNRAFAAAANAASGRVVVILTHGTKTGFIAPVTPPADADVIVDACQARIAPQTIAAYLRRGWPVVLTGSKFYGGPAFSGAILFPAARLPALERDPHRWNHRSGESSSQTGVSARSRAVNETPGATSWSRFQEPAPTETAPERRLLPDGPKLGTLLRWAASLTEIDAFAQKDAASDLTQILADRTASIERALASNPALVPIRGLQTRGPNWADQPSIFTFAVRDPADHRRRLSAADLRPIHQRLACAGVLFGQPVHLGAFGGLRIAIGARDLAQHADPGLARMFAELGHAITASDAMLPPSAASKKCS